MYHEVYYAKTRGGLALELGSHLTLTYANLNLANNPSSDTYPLQAVDAPQMLRDAGTSSEHLISCHIDAWINTIVDKPQ